MEFRVSQTERQMIEKAAEAAHTVPATWIRQTVLAAALKSWAARAAKLEDKR
jgi:uncharacterized protein (DUF1778 family)